MARYRISLAADQDLEEILRWTHEKFGEEARLRYEALFGQAIRDIAADPERVGCLTRPEIAKDAFTYHLAFSRERNAKLRVRRPRHFLLCRIARDGVLEIGRVLHDSMDLARHLPDGYRDDQPE